MLGTRRNPAAMAKQRAETTSAERATPSLQSGRVQQKARTRKALVDAAIEFVRAGRDFSVGDVADAASVGRATAYNYFKTKESLYAQAVLTFVTTNDYPSFDVMFSRTAGVEARVQAVVEASDASIRLHEGQYRALLRSSLEEDDTKLPRRPAHRRQWLTEALEPLRDSLDRAGFDRLVGALSLCIGIEAHVTLRDVCGFSAGDARAIKAWAASALLGAATAGAPAARKPAKTKAQRTSKAPAKPKKRRAS
jgi:AcrR family transcriptional regulator